MPCLGTLASQNVGEIAGSPTGLVWDDPGKTLLCSRTVSDITNVWQYRLSDGNLTERTSGAGPDLSPIQAAGKGLYYVNGRRSGTLTVYSTKTKKSRTSHGAGDATRAVLMYRKNKNSFL